MCVVLSLPLVLSFLHENFSLICINYLEIYQVVSFLIKFKLFEERLVHISQVFVNEVVTVYFRINDAQLFFFGSEQKYFKTVMR